MRREDFMSLSCCRKRELSLLVTLVSCLDGFRSHGKKEKTVEALCDQH